VPEGVELGALEGVELGVAGSSGLLRRRSVRGMHQMLLSVFLPPLSK